MRSLSRSICSGVALRFSRIYLGHGEGDLAFAGENAIGSDIGEFVGLAEVGGAGNDGDGRDSGGGLP